MKREELMLAAQKAILENAQNPVAPAKMRIEPAAEWWEQFGDCYDYWPPLPAGEFDYLTDKSTYPVK